MSFLARFFRMVGWNIPGACWYWLGCKDEKGYGHISVEGKNKKAHRLAYEVFIGPIPSGLLVRHKCDNPSCVNPLHLETGTSADNTRDREERGRTATGAKIHTTKLSEAQVMELRALCANPSIRKVDIARRFGVTSSYVYQISLGKKRKKLQG